MDDTIAAISTPLGTAGIGIIRVSGPAAVATVESLFRSRQQKTLKAAPSFGMLYGHVTEEGQVLDEVLVSVMRGPRSFTGEDVVEINCHGGIVAVRKVLHAVLRAGARLAEPGEFSKRAFLNGRIDLAQAESIIDLINAKTNKGMDIALNQLEGGLSREIGRLSRELLEILAHIEAGIDFPEDDIEDLSRTQIQQKAGRVLADVKKMIETADTGKILREGLRTVIVGKPNVGKSSLLNALVREKRAIVTDVPGTTRDVIEEGVSIRGIPLVLIDTAGIRETEDQVERIGVERTRAMFAQADLVLLMVDASTGLTEEDMGIFPLLEGKNALVIINKTDLPQEKDISAVTADIEKQTGHRDIIEMSLVSGLGLDRLEERIAEMVYHGVERSGEDVLISNVRHRNSLERAAKSLEEVMAALGMGFPMDCLAIDLKGAWESLGEITGETLQADLIDTIFANFCIGK